ncbi:di-heme oxidoredictase family protein [Paucibacter sp. M5-1]|uniref:di-heme oxidoredictase family protein n=1 Tax=Paucibacter sp. M5-1 TaxID=3015998 RepID=UPI0022B8E151|nr:di-heme oxidoredictase family protein [Paucibacter sp. M5-1]MCZ7881687.1 hypothetical protein [Paucibacter sp. M5-1]
MRSSWTWVGGGRDLHDGRARMLQEAILWHGEATDSCGRFEALSKSERDAVIEFLRSL